MITQINQDKKQINHHKITSLAIPKLTENSIFLKNIIKNNEKFKDINARNNLFGNGPISLSSNIQNIFSSDKKRQEAMNYVKKLRVHNSESKLDNNLLPSSNVSIRDQKNTQYNINTNNTNMLNLLKEEQNFKENSDKKNKPNLRKTAYQFNVNNNFSNDSNEPRRISGYSMIENQMNKKDFMNNNINNNEKFDDDYSYNDLINIEYNMNNKNINNISNNNNSTTKKKVNFDNYQSDKNQNKFYFNRKLSNRNVRFTDTIKTERPHKIHNYNKSFSCTNNIFNDTDFIYPNNSNQYEPKLNVEENVNNNNNGFYRDSQSPIYMDFENAYNDYLNSESNINNNNNKKDNNKEVIYDNLFDDYDMNDNNVNADINIKLNKNKRPIYNINIDPYLEDTDHNEISPINEFVNNNSSKNNNNSNNKLRKAFSHTSKINFDIKQKQKEYKINILTDYEININKFKQNKYQDNNLEENNVVDEHIFCKHKKKNQIKEFNANEMIIESLNNEEIIKEKNKKVNNYEISYNDNIEILNKKVNNYEISYNDNIEILKKKENNYEISYNDNIEILNNKNGKNKLYEISQTLNEIVLKNEKIKCSQLPSFHSDSFIFEILGNNALKENIIDKKSSELPDTKKPNKCRNQFKSKINNIGIYHRINEIIINNECNETHNNIIYDNQKHLKNLKKNDNKTLNDKIQADNDRNKFENKEKINDKIQADNDINKFENKEKINDNIIIENTNSLQNDYNTLENNNCYQINNNQKIKNKKNKFLKNPENLNIIINDYENLKCSLPIEKYIGGNDKSNKDKNRYRNRHQKNITQQDFFNENIILEDENYDKIRAIIGRKPLSKIFKKKRTLLDFLEENLQSVKFAKLADSSSSESKKKAQELRKKLLLKKKK